MKSDSKREERHGQKTGQPQPQQWPGKTGQPRPQWPAKTGQPETKPATTWPGRPSEPEHLG